MVDALLDSSIVVDVLRGYDPAVDWLATQSDLGVTRIIWLELIEGAQNKSAQTQATQFLSRFEIVKLVDADMAWAMKQLMQYKLSHNVDSFDCLIASVNARLNLTLFTRNLKHFIPLIGDLARSPY